MAAATLHLTRPTTDEWVASVIPQGIRGRYLGRSLQIAGITGILATLAVGQIADAIGRRNTGGLALFLAVGGLFGVLAVLALRRATMPAVSASARFHWSDLPGIVRDRPFRRCALGIVAFNIPFWLCGPYHQVFYLEVLEMRPSAIAYLTSGYFLLRALLSPLFGRWLDRLGPRRLLWMVSPLYVLFFCGFFLSAPGRLWPVFAGWMAAGLADAGYGVAYSASIYASIPNTPARPTCFALLNLSLFGMAAAGAAGAVFLLAALKPMGFRLGPMNLGQFHLLYVIAAAMMAPLLLSIRFFPGRRDEE